MRIRHIMLAVVLALCVTSAQAGTVTWQFVESSGGSGPGTIGGLLTLNSPPVNLTPGVSWTAITSDVVNFRVLDPSIGPVGSYDLNLNVASTLDGIGPNFVNVREVSGENAAGDVAFSNISGALNASNLGVGLAGGGSGMANGDWVVVPASVPEPSSLVMAGVAALAGLGAWARRRRSARRA